MLDFGLARQYTNTTGEVRPVRGHHPSQPPASLFFLSAAHEYLIDLDAADFRLGHSPIGSPRRKPQLTPQHIGLMYTQRNHIFFYWFSSV